MKVVLYLGTDPLHFMTDGHLIHYPVIKIIPRDASCPDIKEAFTHFSRCSHILFTSKNAVFLFFSLLEKLSLPKEQIFAKKCIAIGDITALTLKTFGVVSFLVSKESSQEGLIKELSDLDFTGSSVFFPRSSLSRPVLVEFFRKKSITFWTVDLYDTMPQKPLPIPDLQKVDEIIFTSPSTVNAFFEIFSSIPPNVKLSVIGNITEDSLKKKLANLYDSSLVNKNL